MPPLSDEERDMLAQYLPTQGTGSAPFTTAPGEPWNPSTASFGAPQMGGNAHAPAPLRPPSLAGVGADQTVAYSGPPPGGAPMTPPPQVQAPPQVTSSGGTTTQMGIQLSPQTRQLQQQADEQTQAGMAGEDAALAASQRARHAQATTDFANAGVAQAEAAQERARHEAILAPKRAALEQGWNDLATRKVDPNRYWNSKSTGAKIALTLGNALGEASKAFTHADTNATGRAIQQHVENDIKAQEGEVENRKASLQGQGVAYNLASSAFHDAEEKSQAQRVLGLQAAAKLTEDRAQQAQDPIERYRLMQVHGNVIERLADAHAKLDEATSKKVTTHSSYSSTSGGPSAAQTGGVPSERIVRAPDGRMMLVDSADSAKALRADNAIRERLMSNIQRAKQLRGSGQIPGTDAHTQLGVTLSDIRRDYMALNQKRMPPEQSAAQLDAAIGNPDSLFDWHGATRLDALGQGVQKGQEDDYAAYNATPLDPGNIATVNGKVVYQTPSVPNYASSKGGKRRAR